MFTWLKERKFKKAAEELGLRDRGETAVFYKDGKNGRNKAKIMVCPICKGRLRIGIDNNKVALKYCWRCLMIFDLPNNYTPPGEKIEIEKKGKIIQIKRKQ